MPLTSVSGCQEEPIVAFFKARSEWPRLLSRQIKPFDLPKTETPGHFCDRIDADLPASSQKWTSQKRRPVTHVDAAIASFNPAGEAHVWLDISRAEGAVGGAEARSFLRRQGIINLSVGRGHIGRQSSCW